MMVKKIQKVSILRIFFYLNKVISNLEINGKVVQEANKISEAQTIFFK